MVQDEVKMPRSIAWDQDVQKCKQNLKIRSIIEFIARVPRCEKIGSLFSSLLNRVVSAMQLDESLEGKCLARDVDDLLGLGLISLVC